MMELEAGFAGTRLHAHQTEVTSRKATNYAASIADNNPLYFDDRRPGSQTAPPMLAVALTWPISSNLGHYLKADNFPAEVLMTQVHYTERLEFHRPARPGDLLTIEGTLAAILPHRAGTHVIMRYQAVDQAKQPVFTEYSGVMLRGVTCKGRSTSLNLPPDPTGDWAAGPLWCQEIQIEPLLPYVYDGCSDIVFEIHTSPAFAESVGLPGNILQGTCTLALAARELVNKEAGGEPQRLRALSCRFSGMVRPGTHIHVELKSKHGEELFFEVINHEGEKAVSKGYARISDDPR